VPSNSILGAKGGTSGSSISNTYEINIELNGTNVTVDDVMGRFKKELALVGAKEGRNRTFGGNT